MTPPKTNYRKNDITFPKDYQQFLDQFNKVIPPLLNH